MAMYLRQHKDDSEMLELVERLPSKRVVLWAAMHKDVVQDDDKLRSEIEHAGDAKVRFALDA